MTVYSLDDLLFLSETSMFSMSISNCCFLTYIQIFQEAGQVVWNAHLLQNFPLDGDPCCAKAFKFSQVPFVYFCFYFRYSQRWVIEDLALIYVIKWKAYAFL